MRSKETLEAFTKYCEDHPREHFYQALCNFAGFLFLYGQEEPAFLKTAIDRSGNIIKLHELSAYAPLPLDPR
jgi:hypothetical protein